MLYYSKKLYDVSNIQRPTNDFVILSVFGSKLKLGLNLDPWKFVSVTQWAKKNELV